MSLKKLEKELGVTLFLRGRGGLELTEEGELLVEHVDRVLDELDFIQTELFRRQPANQPLRLLSCDPPSLRYFSAAILQAHQSLSMQTVLVKNPEAVAVLESGEADIVFTAEPIDATGIASLYLCEAVMSISVAPGHELYEKKQLSWSDLDRQTFLTPSGTSFLLSRIGQIEEEKGLCFNRVVQDDSALFFQMSRRTQYLYFDSTIDHLLPRNPQRRNVAVIDSPVRIRYYGSYLESESARLEPFITSIQRYYWIFENEARSTSLNVAIAGKTAAFINGNPALSDAECGLPSSRALQRGFLSPRKPF